MHWIAILISIFLGFFAFYNELKQKTDAKEEKIIELEQKLEDVQKKSREQERILAEKNSREKGIKLIIQNHSYSYQKATYFYDLLEKTHYWYDYEFSKTAAEQENIIRQSAAFYNDCTDIYIPFSKENGLDITLDILGYRKEFFVESLYSLISYQSKIHMIDQWDNDKIKIQPNIKILYETLSNDGLYADPEKTFSGNTAPISSDEAFNIAESFNNYFEINLSKSDLLEVAAEEYEHHSSFEIEKIFCRCISRSSNYICCFSKFSFDKTKYPKAIIKDIEDILQDTICNTFERYIYDLFFSVVYYDISDCHIFIHAHQDYFFKQATESYKDSLEDIEKSFNDSFETDTSIK